MLQVRARSGIDPVDQPPGGTQKPEARVARLRQVDVFVSQGGSMAEAVRSIGVTRFASYRWRKECGRSKRSR